MTSGASKYNLHFNYLVISSFDYLRIGQILSDQSAWSVLNSYLWE